MFNFGFAACCIIVVNKVILYFCRNDFYFIYYRNYAFLI